MAQGKRTRERVLHVHLNDREYDSVTAAAKLGGAGGVSTWARTHLLKLARSQRRRAAHTDLLLAKVRPRLGSSESEAS